MKLYRAYEIIVGKNYELCRKIDYFWKKVRLMNKYIIVGNNIKAKEICDDLYDREIYSIDSYNLFEMQNCLMEKKNLKIWKSKKESKKNVSLICERYYDIIETLIYNHMIKSNCDKDVDAYKIQKYVVDFLVKNSDEISKLISYKEDKRVVMKAVFDSSLKCERESLKIGYVWGSYYLK